MKKIVFFLLFSCLALTTFSQDSQSIFAQAQNLYCHRILEAATPTITVDPPAATDLKSLYADKDQDGVIAALNANPFMAGITFRKKASADAGGFSSVIGKAGSLDVTNVANAVASLMIDRAKQELTLAFFDRLKKFSDKTQAFKTLFPKTADNLANLLSYNYPQMLPVLRNGFLTDLDKLSFNLEAVLQLSDYQNLIKKYPEVDIAVKLLGLAHKLEHGATPAQMITDISNAVTTISTSPVLDKKNTNFLNVATSFQFTAVFSESLRDPENKHIWITGEQVNLLISDDIFTKLYLGLLYQQLVNKPLYFYLSPGDPTQKTDVASLMLKQKDNLSFFQREFSRLLSVTSEVENAYTAIKSKQATGQALSADDFHGYVSTAIDATTYTLGIAKLFYPDLSTDSYLKLATKSNDLYKDIYSKQYVQAVSDAVDVLTGIQQLTKGSDDAGVAQANKTVLDFITKARPYALFIGTVAEAKNEGDIKSALDNAILPVGSSSIKKNTAGNLSIQSYLGAYFTTRNNNPDAIRAWSDKFGVYGPIGLAYTPGFTSWGKGGSLSLFGSVFDLGAIIDYKLKQDPTTQNSTNPATASAGTKSYSINLGQLFSPGIHLVYGLFENIPLSLGFGAQYGPGLSKIDATGTTSVINPNWRFNAFLAVDLPFFTLSNKAKSSK